MGGMRDRDLNIQIQTKSIHSCGLQSALDQIRKTSLSASVQSIPQNFFGACAFILPFSQNIQCSFFLCAHSKENPCCGSPEETFILLQSLPFKRHLHGEHKEYPLAPTRSRQRQRCDPLSVLLPQSQLLRDFCLYCIPLISCGRLCLTQIPFLSFSSAPRGGKGDGRRERSFSKLQGFTCTHGCPDISYCWPPAEARFP